MSTGAASTEVGRGSVLDLPLREAGVPVGRASAPLRRLGVTSVRDLLFHLPRRHDDFSRQLSLRELRERTFEGPVSATVTIVDLRVEAGFRRRVQRTVARLRDDTGEGEAIWFGRRYVERRMKAGDVVALSGKVELRGWLPRFQNPEFGLAGEGTLHAGRIVPVYRLTAGLTVGWLRQRIHDVLERTGADIEDYLPAAAEPTEEQLVGLRDALEWVHFPPRWEDLERALRRLAFDELLALQLGMVARSRQRTSERALPIAVEASRAAEVVEAVEQVIGEQVAARRREQAQALEQAQAPEQVRARAEDPAAEAERAGPDDGRASRSTTAPDLPAIRLTDDQRSAIAAVASDLGGERPMMRLLQGDVGSGKTAVAAVALCLVADAGAQGALLAPTDLLARQHAVTLGRLLEPVGHEVVLLTGSLAPAARRNALDAIAAPQASLEGRSLGRVVVGTHALVQEHVTFEDLRLVVVDEQHRFGVAQREALAGKGRAPHVLLMTATPIPRTLGQIVHADLEVSDLRTPPAGRQRVRTGIRRTDELLRRRDGSAGALVLLAREVTAGRRGFVVVPLVEEDEDAGARSVEQAAELVRSQWAQALSIAGLAASEPRIEIVHGQVRPSERDERMERFRSGEAQVLVGTTVVEVGVDVPQASVMLILDADRFGVAQLHQLRGRVGRGEAESYCVLVSERYPAGQPSTDEEATVKARLDALVSTSDGFVLAEMDLEQRREGDLLGLTQSGMPPLRVASLGRSDHRELSVAARRVAEELLDEGGRLPGSAAALERELAHGWLARVGAGEVLGSGLAGAGDG
ncbi:MAG TPA: ATP-dependent DNA helicase RecG [Candidatus Limnocylindrales bacterium]|nr:ATP-dependent DNA helicase RecG [Candidatus Limnocylindrales bacterium]